jgi:ATP-binding cassette, subfamily B, bacterial PglK
MSTMGRIYRMLTPDQRRSAVILFGMLLIGMGLETLGIGLVIPLLGLLASRDITANYPVLVPLLGALGDPSREQLIVWAMLALVALYGIKTLFLGFLAWQQSRFAFGVQASISQRLFNGYLRQPWAFHLQRNSAQLIRNATTEVSQFTNNGLLPGILLLTECLIVTGIGVLLLVVEPVGALAVILTLGVAAWLFQRATRNHILRWGKTRQHHDGLRLQHLQQGLGGAKDVKLLGREGDFLAQYSIHNLGVARVARRQNTLKQLPRLWLELLAVVGLAGLVLVMLAQGKPLDGLLPTLGLFAAAAFRLMPSANRMLGALQGLRFSLPVVETLDRELNLLEDVAPPAVSSPLLFQQSLVLEAIAYRYPDSESNALESVSLVIRRGTSVGFIGGTGAGKSTLVDVVLGLLAPTGGKVLVDGVDIQTNLRGWQNQIGYVPQSIFLTDDTLRRNVAFGLADQQINDQEIERALRAAQMDEFVRSLPRGINTIVGERGVRLSGGQRQRIGIARALYHDPAVLVLDEATSSLDVATETGVMQAINELHGQKTVLIVAHRLSTVSGCDRIFRLERGRLVEAGDARTVLGALSGNAS